MKHLQEITALMKQHASVEYYQSSQRFFKQTAKMHGVKVPLARQIAHEYYKKLSDLNDDEVLSLCTQLFQTGFMEEQIGAVYFAATRFKKLDKEKTLALLGWLNYVENWASCDNFCPLLLGRAVEQGFLTKETLFGLAGDSSQWKRRAAIVSLLKLVKKPFFHELILEVLEKLCNDSEDYVRKANGWLLRELWKANPKAAEKFLLTHKGLPRVTLRYAIEKMDKGKKKEFMERG